MSLVSSRYRAYTRSLRIIIGGGSRRSYLVYLSQIRQDTIHHKEESNHTKYPQYEQTYDSTYYFARFNRMSEQVEHNKPNNKNDYNQFNHNLKRRRGAAKISLVATTDHLYSDTLDLRSFTCRWRTETYAHTTFKRGQVRICSSARRLHSSTLPLSYLILPPILRSPFLTKVLGRLMA